MRKLKEGAGQGRSSWGRGRPVILRPGAPSLPEAAAWGPAARGLGNPPPGPAWTAAWPGVVAEFAVSPAAAAGAEKPLCQLPPNPPSPPPPRRPTFLLRARSSSPAATSRLRLRTLRIQQGGGGKGPGGDSGLKTESDFSSVQ